MTDLGPYSFYIAGAYAVASLCLGVLLLVTLYDLGAQKKKLSELEQ